MSGVSYHAAFYLHDNGGGAVTSVFSLRKWSKTSYTRELEYTLHVVGEPTDIADIASGGGTRRSPEMDKFVPVCESFKTSTMSHANSTTRGHVAHDVFLLWDHR